MLSPKVQERFIASFRAYTDSVVVQAQDRERAKKVAKDILEPLVTQAKQECRDREFLDALRAASQTTDLAFKIGQCSPVRGQFSETKAWQHFTSPIQPLSQ